MGRESSQEEVKWQPKGSKVNGTRSKEKEAEYQRAATAGDFPFFMHYRSISVAAPWYGVFSLATMAFGPMIGHFRDRHVPNNTLVDISSSDWVSSTYCCTWSDAPDFRWFGNA
jgi:hypothetical protein